MNSRQKKVAAKRRNTRIRKNPEFSQEEWDALSFVLGWCMRCGSTVELTRDHKEPIGKGGGNTLSNLTLLCRTCNELKGAKRFPEITPKYLLPSQEERLRSLPDSLRAVVTEAIYGHYSSH